MSQMEKYQKEGFYYPVLNSGHLAFDPSKGNFKRKADKIELLSEVFGLLVDDKFIISVGAAYKMQDDIKSLPECPFTEIK